MLSFDKIYLVRHGSYNRDPQELTADGKLESESAGQRLLSAGVKPEATLLSSDAPRAVQTAGIIATLIETSVTPSKRINVIGNNPQGVESLDEMLEAALVEADLETTGESLVVVSHQPLLNVAARGARVATGQVVEYQPQTWQNPKFNTEQQAYLSRQLSIWGLA